MQLSTITNLFIDREKEIKLSINNLQLSEVKTEQSFSSIVHSLKDRFLLTPASIGDARIKDHRQESRHVPIEHQMFYGRTPNFFVVTVQFSVTGSEEVFCYRSNGGSLPITAVHTPEYGALTIEIELQELDKQKVLAEAENEIRTTREIILQNNPTVEAWSARAEVMIDELASQKRKELLEFYN